MNRSRLSKIFCAVGILLLCSLFLASCGRSDAGTAPDTAGAAEEAPLLSEEEVKKGKIAVQTGTSCALIAEKTFPDATVMNFSTTPDCLTALGGGSVDAVFLNETVANRFISERGGGFVCLATAFGNECEGFVFPKTDEGRALKTEFNEFLGKLSESGELKELIDTWLDDSIDKDGFVPELPDSGENGTLTLATEGSYYPFSYFVGNRISGLDIVLAADFCREYGYGLKVSDMLFDGLIPSIASGKCDFAGSGITITDERRESVDFSDVVSSDALVLLVKSDGAGKQAGFIESVTESFRKTFIREGRWKMILDGVETTVFISLLSAAIGTVLGFGICMLRRTKSRAAHAVTSVYISVLQGTPLVVLLMILFYVVFAKSSISGVWVAIIAFALNFAAYVSEMIRTGIDSVDRGQTEAALALGYTRSAAFFKIVMPQAAIRFLPVYKGEFISLVKMTSVVGYIAVQDLTKVSDIIRSRTYEAFFPLIATAVIYFTISWLLTLLLKFIEKKTAPDRKKRVVKGVVTE